MLLENKSYYPSKIICIGRNYHEHIKELANELPASPVIFIKPNSAISQKLLIDAAQSLHYEAELCFLVISGEISGVGFGLDITDRQQQSYLKKHGLPWEKAKAFDNAAVLSDFIPIDKKHIKYLSFALMINGKLVQEGNYAQMIYKPQQLITEIQKSFTLVDGDIMMSGTPKGVGVIEAGDLFTWKIKQGNKVILQGQWQAAYSPKNIIINKKG
ncbi:fumarylacetoacetate hydrolase family protein [Facilibium subflavum]|uniref:fumarylacetoacetate hydrolase family protein n=1 Tax=Facilibium subflavum TaxID=2219058 RepID=UPI001F2524F0|nr:fumarylacetoacetate hydrolase family protein [Facilibium subflavum]